MKGKVDYSTIRAGNFNIPLSLMDKTIREQTNKEIDVNNTIN